MNRAFSLITLAVCMALFAAASQGAKPDKTDTAPTRRYLAAFNAMERADWLAEKEMEEEAVDSYGEALELFLTLAEEYPGWESESVGFRASYCKQRMAELKLAGPDSLHDKKTDAQFEEARNLEKTSSLDKALGLYQAALAQDASNLEALKGALRCQLRMGSVPVARALIHKHVSEPISDPDLLVMMALVYCYEQQFDLAMQTLRLTLNDNPNNPEAYVAMGVALAGQGRLDAAVNEMKRALSFNTAISEAYYNLAWISLKQNPANIALVLTHYNNALKYGGERDPLIERLIK